MLLEREMATHSSILAWEIPFVREVWQATVHGVTKSWSLSPHRAQAQWPLVRAQNRYDVALKGWDVEVVTPQHGGSQPGACI
jgi:hypothetical protein